MGRKRIDLGAGEQARIALLMNAGKKSAAIAAELGISEATAKRRMASIRGVVADSKTARKREAIKASPVAQELGIGEEDPDLELPADTTLESIDRLLRVAEERAKLAESDEDPENHIKYVRLSAQLLEARRKMLPVPKVDPNDHPDMVEAAARVRKRWHDLADRLMQVANSELALTIHKLLHPDENE